MLSHAIWPPTSHASLYKAYFSAESQSVHVTDAKSIRALWEQGFWGSGSLSRSEPQWLEKEKRNRGIAAITTSEEVTRTRREERRQFKLERAKAQREAIEQQLREEGKLDAETNLDELVENGDVTESPKGTLYPVDNNVPLGNIAAHDEVPVVEELSNMLAEQAPSLDIVIEDQEHLQITFEEAFFLSYALGILDIYDSNTRLEPPTLLRLFCEHSEFLSNIRDGFSKNLSRTIEPDNSFLVNYVVFHHFRSLGWVVRPGIKFACDYLLYLRGPAFTHAEFAIMIIPAYSNSYWLERPERAAACKKKERKDWWWLHRLNRVQTQVHKTLMLVYVEIPPPWDVRDSQHTTLNIANLLNRYHVRESVWRRWSPNRNR